MLYRDIKVFSTPFYAVFGIFSLYYIIIGLGWMLLYSLGLSHLLSIKVYVAGLIILTLLWLIISILTAQTDSNYKVSTDKLKEERYTLEFYAQKISMLASQYEKICDEREIVYQTHSNNRTVLDKLKMKIEFLTPNVFRNETVCIQLNAMLDKCETLLEEIASAPENTLPEAEKKIERFVNKSVDELNMLKNLTRK